jgi:hypothetical protein
MATTTTKQDNNATSQQAKNTVSSGVDKVKDAVQSSAEAVKGAADYGIDKARDLASSAGHLAGQAASSAGHLASQAASTAGQYASKAADTATSSVGSGMESLGHTVRDNAPHSGMLGSAASTVANTLEQGGRYIREEGLGGMTEDVTNAIRRNPIPAVLCAVAVGFLLARATRS